MSGPPHGGKLGSAPKEQLSEGEGDGSGARATSNTSLIQQRKTIFWSLVASAIPRQEKAQLLIAHPLDFSPSAPKLDDHTAWYKFLIQQAFSLQIRGLPTAEPGGNVLSDGLIVPLTYNTEVFYFVNLRSPKDKHNYPTVLVCGPDTTKKTEAALKDILTKIWRGSIDPKQHISLILRSFNLSVQITEPTAIASRAQAAINNGWMPSEWNDKTITSLLNAIFVPSSLEAENNFETLNSLSVWELDQRHASRWQLFRATMTLLIKPPASLWVYGLSIFDIQQRRPFKCTYRLRAAYKARFGGPWLCLHCAEILSLFCCTPCRRRGYYSISDPPLETALPSDHADDLLHQLRHNDLTITDDPAMLEPQTKPAEVTQTLLQHYVVSNQLQRAIKALPMIEDEACHNTPLASSTHSIQQATDSGAGASMPSAELEEPASTGQVSTVGFTTLHAVAFSLAGNTLPFVWALRQQLDQLCRLPHVGKEAIISYVNRPMPQSEYTAMHIAIQLRRWPLARILLDFVKINATNHSAQTVLTTLAALPKYSDADEYEQMEILCGLLHYNTLEDTTIEHVTEAHRIAISKGKLNFARMLAPLLPVLTDEEQAAQQYQRFRAIARQCDDQHLASLATKKTSAAEDLAQLRDELALLIRPQDDAGSEDTPEPHEHQTGNAEDKQAELEARIKRLEQWQQQLEQTEKHYMALRDNNDIEGLFYRALTARLQEAFISMLAAAGPFVHAKPTHWMTVGTIGTKAAASAVIASENIGKLAKIFGNGLAIPIVSGCLELLAQGLGEYGKYQQEALCRHFSRLLIGPPNIEERARRLAYRIIQRYPKQLKQIRGADKRENQPSMELAADALARYARLAMICEMIQMIKQPPSLAAIDDALVQAVGKPFTPEFWERAREIFTDPHHLRFASLADGHSVFCTPPDVFALRPGIQTPEGFQFEREGATQADIFGWREGSAQEATQLGFEATNPVGSGNTATVQASAILRGVPTPSTQAAISGMIQQQTASLAARVTELEARLAQLTSTSNPNNSN